MSLAFAAISFFGFNLTLPVKLSLNLEQSSPPLHPIKLSLIALV